MNADTFGQAAFGERPVGLGYDDGWNFSGSNERENVLAGLAIYNRTFPDEDTQPMSLEDSGVDVDISPSLSAPDDWFRPSKSVETPVITDASSPSESTHRLARVVDADFKDVILQQPEAGQHRAPRRSRRAVSIFTAASVTVASTLAVVDGIRFAARETTQQSQNVQQEPNPTPTNETSITPSKPVNPTVTTTVTKVQAAQSTTEVKIIVAGYQSSTTPSPSALPTTPLMNLLPSATLESTAPTSSPTNVETTPAPTATPTESAPTTPLPTTSPPNTPATSSTSSPAVFAPNSSSSTTLAADTLAPSTGSSR